MFAVTFKKRRLAAGTMELKCYFHISKREKHGLVVFSPDPMTKEDRRSACISSSAKRSQPNAILTAWEREQRWMNCRTVQVPTCNSKPWDKTVHPFTRERKQNTVVVMSPYFLKIWVSPAALGLLSNFPAPHSGTRGREGSGDHSPTGSTSPKDISFRYGWR